MKQDIRLEQLEQWVNTQLGEETLRLRAISNDASFRRYFRTNDQNHSFIAVDSPPDTENNQAFSQISELLTSHDVLAPRIIAIDYEKGLMLQTDLGDRLYLPELTRESSETLYTQAFATLEKMQLIPSSELANIPNYDNNALIEEMMLFKDWFLERYLSITLSPEEEQLIEHTFNQLAANALAQRQVFVHRDYHSRNLLVCQENSPGVIDFQDAVSGPVTYDLVSLLKDCYIEWPESRVKDWCKLYYNRIFDQQIIETDFDSFYKDFELIGIQRHLKVLGIFCRLNYRDQKPAYLSDLPLTFSYLLKAVARYPELNEFYSFLIQRVEKLFVQRTR